ncbi:glyoxalase [Novosphingobium sp.]|uniref:glyoxalase n=1 Tax=Novosphingobium sp. TaxID=1874826 RepID=UPI0025DDD338|nr:glyoxalase [Novosphingobium sp.]
MPRVVAIDHVQLAMPAGGEDIARGYYGTLLGLDEVPKPSPLAARGGCWFEAQGVKIHLGVEADFRAARKAHPALLVDDLMALAALIEQTGGELRWDTELPEVLRCHVADPFGNRIELIQA